jgi:hypothetical protein
MVPRFDPRNLPVASKLETTSKYIANNTCPDYHKITKEKRSRKKILME